MVRDHMFGAIWLWTLWLVTLWFGTLWLGTLWFGILWFGTLCFGTYALGPYSRRKHDWKRSFGCGGSLQTTIRSIEGTCVLQRTFRQEGWENGARGQCDGSGFPPYPTFLYTRRGYRVEEQRTPPRSPVQPHTSSRCSGPDDDSLVETCASKCSAAGSSIAPPCC